jgi:hypothetical protein
MWSCQIVDISDTCKLAWDVVCYIDWRMSIHVEAAAITSGQRRHMHCLHALQLPAGTSPLGTLNIHPRPTGQRHTIRLATCKPSPQAGHGTISHHLSTAFQAHSDL